MPIGSLVLPFLVIGCNDTEPPCAADIAVWEDLDLDGFGGASLGKVCVVEEGQVEVAQDCDDADEGRNPSAVETCDGIDNDCDGQVDDDANLRQFWFDGDGDGYGGLFQSTLACEDPGDEWVKNQDDCDDANAAINPDAIEVCGRVDEDCDGYIDEADDSVDPASFSTFYADKDGDNYGDRNDTVQQCRLSEGYVLEGNDCNDTDPSITQKVYWSDLDEDGYGDPATAVEGCIDAPPGTVENDDDCDDSSPEVTYESDWFSDPDGDGYGSGLSLGFACSQPVPGSIRESGDCNEFSPEINPGAIDICEDGLDQDCSGSDAPCGPIGSYLVEDGPAWSNDPPVLSCVEACAEVFGGTSSDYQCSTSSVVVDNRGYLSGWGDQTYCFNAQPEDFKVEPAGNPGYDCGSFGCAYSAYVLDNCTVSAGSSARNWCWSN